MNDLKKAASALGKKGGSVKSEKKALSSKENGKKGGRPAKNSELLKLQESIKHCSTCGRENFDDDADLCCIDDYELKMAKIKSILEASNA